MKNTIGCWEESQEKAKRAIFESKQVQRKLESLLQDSKLLKRILAERELQSKRYIPKVKDTNSIVKFTVKDILNQRN